MASFETNTSPSFSFGATLSRVWNVVFDAMCSIPSAHHRVAQMEALQRLSDQELAHKGLRREDIARHVFRDMYFI